MRGVAAVVPGGLLEARVGRPLLEDEVDAGVGEVPQVLARGRHVVALEVLGVAGGPALAPREGPPLRRRRERRGRRAGGGPGVRVGQVRDAEQRRERGDAALRRDAAQGALDVEVHLVRGQVQDLLNGQRPDRRRREAAPVAPPAVGEGDEVAAALLAVRHVEADLERDEVHAVGRRRRRRRRRRARGRGRRHDRRRGRRRRRRGERGRRGDGRLRRRARRRQRRRDRRGEAGDRRRRRRLAHEPAAEDAEREEAGRLLERVVVAQALAGDRHLEARLEGRAGDLVEARGELEAELDAADVRGEAVVHAVRRRAVVNKLARERRLRRDVEDVGRARMGPGAADVLVVRGPDHDGAAVDGRGKAEIVVRRGVAGRQLGHLGVRGAAVGRKEEVGRARGRAAVVVPVGPNQDGVAVDRHGDAEAVLRPGVAGRQLDLVYVAHRRSWEGGRAGEVVVMHGPDHDFLAARRRGVANLSLGPPSACSQLGHLGVGGAAVVRAEVIGRDVPCLPSLWPRPRRCCRRWPRSSRSSL